MATVTVICDWTELPCKHRWHAQCRPRLATSVYVELLVGETLTELAKAGEPSAFSSACPLMVTASALSTDQASVEESPGGIVAGEAVKLVMVGDSRELTANSRELTAPGPGGVASRLLAPPTTAATAAQIGSTRRASTEFGSMVAWEIGG